MTATVASIRCLYVAINIQNILYGAELVLYFQTIHILLGNRGAHKRSNLCYALFSTMMVFLATIWVVTQAVFGEHMWLLHSDYPGGAVAYWKANIGVWYMHLAAITVIVLQLMTDALMIYRCRMMWSSYRIVVVPIILWFATLTLGGVVVWLTNSPGNDFYTGIASRFSLAYWSISVFLNVTLTCMICYRLMRHGKRIQEHLGHEYASLYFTITMVVIESVLPYTLSGIAFLVALGMDSATSMAFIRVYFLMMCISPQMLILRVVRGKSWRNDTPNRPGSTIKFNHSGASESASRWSDGTAAEAHVLTSLNMRRPDGHDDVGISEV